MADRVLPGPVDHSARVKEAVCIHTKKIFDSCREKDCVEDLRVFPTEQSQAYIDAACSIRPRSAELLHVCVDVEKITFNRGNYTVDVTYFYRVRGEVCPGAHEVTGLAVFSKRVVLFGSEGSVRTFSSNYCQCVNPAGDPTATVEAVDPMALSMKLADPGCCPCSCDTVPEIPCGIIQALGEDVVFANGGRLWYVTLGQFSIIRLERETQLVMPVYDYCFPENECAVNSSEEEDACTFFGRIDFPQEEFFPANRVCECETYKKKC